MSLRKKILGRSWLAGGVLAVSVLCGSFTAHAQEASPVAVSCGSTETTLGENFGITPDQPIALVCSLKNSSAQSVSVMLLGKLLSPGQSQPSGSSTDVVLDGNATVQAKLSFAPVFRNGTYVFTFVAFDAMTGKPIGAESTLTGTLGSTNDKQIRIASASLEKGEYRWGDTFDLDLFLDVPEGRSLSDITTTVVMQDKDGQTCSTLAERRLLTKAADKLALTFPKEAGECINALNVTLQSKDGKVVDKKILAVGLVYSETVMTPNAGQETATPQSGMSPLAIGILVFVAVFLVVLVGYTLMKRKSPVV
jgi:hypothetical protein